MVVAHRPSMAARWQRAARSAALGEVCAVSGFGDFAGQTDGEHRFPDAGRPDQQDVGRRLEVAVGCQVPDEGRVDTRLGLVVEVLQGGRAGQAREPEPAGEPAGFGGLHFDAEQPFQGGGGRELLGLGLVQDGG